MNNSVHKQEGFEGQRLIVLPKKVISPFLITDKLTRSLFVTDIGYYPRARFHFIERSKGIDQFIIIYCIEGKGWIEINKKKRPIKPSTLFIIPASMPHRYGSSEKEPWTIYWIHFKGEAASSFVDHMQKQFPKGQSHLTFNENRIKLFEEIYANLEKGYSEANLRYVNMVFSHFLSSLLYEEKFNYSENKQYEDIVDKTITLMQKKLHTNIGLPELAAFSKFSVAHFSALFRKKTGHAPIQYFNHLKIQKACQYLLFTDMNVRLVASKLGFNDPYYFSRLFTQLMGLSPLQYRKRNS
ncbi:AraC family transcriptional regulator [Niastella vici]|uniref:AraC family transcriptional regulator n=1 Tax=Niastella vici TaxID=1703345 RepID=A0A1V9G071_9BACT|nr:AraC family transcriptional regulator [Niastella vici]OQP63977.1 AraC family transcriptional regulator [Niastella vici]